MCLSLVISEDSCSLLSSHRRQSPSITVVHSNCRRLSLNNNITPLSSFFHHHSSSNHRLAIIVSNESVIIVILTLVPSLSFQTSLLQVLWVMIYCFLKHHNFCYDIFNFSMFGLICLTILNERVHGWHGGVGCHGRRWIGGGLLVRGYEREDRKETKEL